MLLDTVEKALCISRDQFEAVLGHLSIDEITPKQVIATVRKIEARGALDVANRVKQGINATCRYAIQQGIATTNPAGDLDGIVKQRNVQHRASLPREQLSQFLKELETHGDRGRLLTQRAIKLLLLTLCTFWRTAWCSME